MISMIQFKCNEAHKSHQHSPLSFSLPDAGKKRGKRGAQASSPSLRCTLTAVRTEEGCLRHNGVGGLVKAWIDSLIKGKISARKGVQRVIENQNMNKINIGVIENPHFKRSLLALINGVYAHDGCRRREKSGAAAHASEFKREVSHSRD